MATPVVVVGILFLVLQFSGKRRTAVSPQANNVSVLPFLAAVCALGAHCHGVPLQRGPLCPRAALRGCGALLSAGGGAAGRVGVDALRGESQKPSTTFDRVGERASASADRRAVSARRAKFSGRAHAQPLCTPSQGWRCCMRPFWQPKAMTSFLASPGRRALCCTCANPASCRGRLACQIRSLPILLARPARMALAHSLAMGLL